MGAPQPSQANSSPTNTFIRPLSHPFDNNRLAWLVAPTRALPQCAPQLVAINQHRAQTWPPNWLAQCHYFSCAFSNSGLQPARISSTLTLSLNGPPNPPHHNGGQKIQSDSVKCCWVCVPCRPREYLFNEFRCKACEKGWWPNSDQTGK